MSKTFADIEVAAGQIGPKINEDKTKYLYDDVHQELKLTNTYVKLCKLLLIWVSNSVALTQQAGVSKIEHKSPIDHMRL